MTIPHDESNRNWIEVSGLNQGWVDNFRPCLISFLAFDRNRNAKFAGSGFIIGQANGLAIALTAKHVLEHISAIQKPDNISFTSLFVKTDNTPQIKPNSLKALWMNSTSGKFFDVYYASYNDSSDIACVLISLEPNQKLNHVIPLSTDLPQVGEVVHMVSLEGMKTTEIVPPIDKTGIGQRLEIYRKVSIRVGTVSSIHPNGLRHYNWPCFTTSIPAEPGMSGGFVYLPRNGKTVAAAGIVCADNSSEAARTNFFESGESIVGCTWLGLGLQVPIYMDDKSPKHTIYEMMKTGSMTEAHGGLEKIVFQKLGNGECLIGLR